MGRKERPTATSDTYRTSRYLELLQITQDYGLLLPNPNNLLVSEIEKPGLQWSTFTS